MDLKEIHDSLLENYPERPHDRSDCPLCASEGIESSPVLGGEMSEKTYTQEELDATVAEAIRPLQESLNDLKAGVEQSEVEARIAAVKAEYDETVKSLQTELDTTTLKATEAEKAMDDLVVLLEEIAAEESETADAIARTEARLSKVEEVASFPEEYMNANAERWAAMPEEEFDALIADWAAISGRKAGAAAATTTDFPEKTAMVASRSDEKSESAVREILNLTLHGVDPRTV